MNVHYGSDVGCEAYEVPLGHLNRPGVSTGSFGIMRMRCLSGVVALGGRKPAVSVPTRYTKHMVVVADLARGDDGAIEDALEAAWELQRGAD
jgi:hypothetical protein